MKSIYYWSPCLTKVGTYKSTINSAISLSKNTENLFKIKIINVCGEWDEEIENFKKNNIELVNLGFKYFKFLPKNGFFKSRFSTLIIIFFSVIPFIRLMLKKKPDYLIIHLITILPLFINYILKFRTKILLRISGYPKLNFIRKSLWKLFTKNISKISCPSEDLKNQLKNLKIFNSKKLVFIPDPIINLREFVANKDQINIKHNNLIHKKKYFVAVGRLTKQKNFTYLIDEFNEFIKFNKDYNLLIFGEGEQHELLKKRIDNYNLKENIYLMGRSENVFYFMKKAEAFILSSLWEDPGFVIIESAMCNLFIISSDCKNGPVEFLRNGKGGILYNANKKHALVSALNNYSRLNNNVKTQKKIQAKKNCKLYTLNAHQKKIKKLFLFS